MLSRFRLWNAVARLLTADCVAAIIGVAVLGIVGIIGLNIARGRAMRAKAAAEREHTVALLIQQGMSAEAAQAHLGQIDTQRRAAARKRGLRLIATGAGLLVLAIGISVVLAMTSHLAPGRMLIWAIVFGAIALARGINLVRSGR